MVYEGDGEPVEQPEQDNQADDQHLYHSRQRTVPVQYGIDKYVDTAFLGGGQMEESQRMEEALESRLSKSWKEAADSEYQSLIENETWSL